MADAWRLGFGEPIAVSATAGEGMADLYAVLQPHVDRWRQALAADALLHTPRWALFSCPCFCLDKGTERTRLLPVRLIALWQPGLWLGSSAPA